MPESRTDHRPRTETDPRLPSGEWVGFFLQPTLTSARQGMELTLHFAAGRVRGEGRDVVGEFTVHGRYDLDANELSFVKGYRGQHNVDYRGFAELDKGIWGVWRLPGFDRGGFHIWPRTMADPTRRRLKAMAKLPLPVKIIEPEPAEVP